MSQKPPSLNQGSFGAWVTKTALEGGGRYTWCLWQPSIEYDCPPGAGEDSTAAKQRDDRHRDREMCVLRQLDGLIVPNQDPSQAADAVHRQQQRQRMAALRESSAETG